MPWKTNDRVRITHEGRTVPGTILLASANNVALMLEFEAILDGHVGMMPVLLHDDGLYRSIVTQTVIHLSHDDTKGK